MYLLLAVLFLCTTGTAPTDMSIPLALRLEKQLAAQTAQTFCSLRPAVSPRCAIPRTQGTNSRSRHHVTGQPGSPQFPFKYRILSPKYSTLHWSFFECHVIDFQLCITPIAFSPGPQFLKPLPRTRRGNGPKASLKWRYILFLLAVPTGDAMLFKKTLFQSNFFLINPCLLCLTTAASWHQKSLSTLLGYRNSAC